MSKMAKIKKEKKTLWQRFTAWVNGDATEQPLLPAEPPKPKKKQGGQGQKAKGAAHPQGMDGPEPV